MRYVSFPPSLLSSLCCHYLCRDESGGSGRGGFLRGVVMERRGSGPVCQRNPPGTWEEGWWPGLRSPLCCGYGVERSEGSLVSSSFSSGQPGGGCLGLSYLLFLPYTGPLSLPRATSSPQPSLIHQVLLWFLPSQPACFLSFFLWVKFNTLFQKNWQCLGNLNYRK